MMERWISYQSRAINAEQRLARELERLAKVQEDLDRYKAEITEKLDNAEKAEERVKGHLRTAREDKKSEYFN